MNIRYLFLLITCACIAAGCTYPAGREAHAPIAPRYLVPKPIITERAEGSLFDPGQNPSLIADFRARQVGDVVTILIQEDLKGSKDVKTKSDRTSNLNIGLTGILGLEWNKQWQPNYPNQTVDATKALGGSTKSKFEGKGNTHRNTKLEGTVSARVIEILPGGNLLVQATRELRINNETQYLVLTGVVRPKDLGPDNTIPSTRLADARIEYTGSGVISENQKPGWLARIMTVVAPF
ncbi:MAG TPA: flagellar basal body L-ring protein FlgH [Thermodesulfobacteriaceae bacterium]|nr:flagellar basal body L-ring protein FlgH [Thermodesulfobacteriaceae bacterium]